jgi:hypothetical protein
VELTTEAICKNVLLGLSRANSLQHQNVQKQLELSQFAKVAGSGLVTSNATDVWQSQEYLYLLFSQTA